MTPFDQLERRLPVLLTELADLQTPDYFEELLWQTAHTSQRSPWTMLERWVPMLGLTRRQIAAPLPWRPVIALLAMLALVAAGLIAAGSRTPLPPAFGPAANGLVVSSNGGDIVTYDPATGVSRAVVTGPGDDRDPIWSQDGTRILFNRQVPGDTPGSLLFSVHADGGGLRQLTPEPLEEIWSYDMSSDGRSIAVNAVIRGIPSLLIVATDGSGARRIDTGMSMFWPSFRPTGADILFVGARGVDGTYGGLYLIDPDGTNLRTLVEPNVDRTFDWEPRWSPDGTSIAYGRWLLIWRQLRVQVISADGTNDRVVGHSDAAFAETRPRWSPDGTRLLIQRNTGPEGDWSARTPIVVTVDGSAPDTVIRYTLVSWGADAEWSPDGSAIQVRPADKVGNSLQQLLWNPVTGESTTAPWTATSYPSWQRVAP